jgi:multidrug efflux pump subunit AcrA (membrane-fusion protein)
MMGEHTMWLSKNSKIFLSIIVAGSVLFGGCGILPKEEQTLAPPLVKPQKQEYQVFEVKKKDITRQVKGNGTLASMNESNLFTKDNGRRIKSVNVQFGQTVKKGDVLATIDTKTLEDEIAQSTQSVSSNEQKAQLSLSDAKQKYDNLQYLHDNNLNTDIINAQAQVDSAKLDLEKKSNTWHTEHQQ